MGLSPRLSPRLHRLYASRAFLLPWRAESPAEREREKERAKRRSLMQMTLTAGKEVIRQLIERRRRVARQSVVPFDARPGARRYPSSGWWLLAWRSEPLRASHADLPALIIFI